MNILITKQNVDFFKEKLGVKALNVVDQTANTITFKITQKRFYSLYKTLQAEGHNVFALMSF